MKVGQSRISKGFSVVELLVAVIVIGILVAVSAVGYGAWRNSVAEAEVKSELKGIASAMEDARTFGDSYPSSIPATFSHGPGVEEPSLVTSASNDFFCASVQSVSDSATQLRVTSLQPEPAAGNCDIFETVTVGSGLVGWWRLNGNAKDSSGNGNHGTVNGPTSTIGQGGSSNTAYNFDGVNDFIELPSDGLTSFGAFSISAWAKITGGPTAVNGHGYILHRGTSVTQGTSIYWIASISTSPFYGGGVSGFNTGGYTTVTADTTTWRLVTMTYDGTTVRVYIDGTFRTSYSIGSITNSTSGNRIGIGGTPHDAAYRPTLGAIDDVRVYDDALTAVQVADIYSAGAL